MNKPRDKDPDDLVQFPIRLPSGVHKTLRKMCIDDGIYLQHLIRRFLELYMEGDPVVLKMIKDWKEESFEPPKDPEDDKLRFEKVERDRMLREIEQLEREEKRS